MAHKIKDVAPDGKMDIVEGVETLKKDPKKKKNLVSRWKLIKKALEHSSAFMNMSEAAKPEEQEPAQEQGEQDEQPDQQAQGQPDEAQMPPEGQPGQDEPPAQEQPDEAQMPPQGGDQEADAPPQEPAPEEPSGPRAYKENETPEEKAAREEELAQLLREEGYSEPEIAYIVHGHHSPVQNELDTAKAESERGMSGLKQNYERQRMDADMQSTLEHAALDKEHKKKLLDLELESKKLELEANKKKLDLDVDFKAKENELKLQHMKEKHKQRLSAANKEADDE